MRSATVAVDVCCVCGRTGQSAMGMSFQAAAFGANLALSALIETDV
jgi:hypothetical protein